MLGYHQPHMLDLMRHFHSGSDYQRCSWSLLHLSSNYPSKISYLKLLQFENKVFAELSKQLNLTSQQKPCCAHACCHLNVLLVKFPTWLPSTPTFKFPFLFRHPTKKGTDIRDHNFITMNESVVISIFCRLLNVHASKFAAAFDLLYPNSLMLLHDRQSKTFHTMC